MRRIISAAAAVAVLGGVGGCGQGSAVRQVGGQLTLSPAAVEFGDVALGKEATIAVSLHNDGIVPLTITQLTQLDGAPFEVTGLPVTLVAGGQSRVTVRYRPPELGTHQHSLQLQTDAPEAPSASLDIHGHAVRGLATLSSDTFDFGDVVVGERSSVSFSLSNNDGHAVTSVRIELPAGGDATAFGVKPPGDSPLKPEQTMQVTIDFTPGRLGDFTAVVPVTPCPTCSARNVSLSGHGVTRLLEVQPAAIDFGEVLLGADQGRPVTVTNLSRWPLTVQAPTSSNAELELLLDGATYPMVFQPGQVVKGVAHYRPRTLGNKAALLSLLASDGAPGTLAVHGLGIGAVLQAAPTRIVVGPTAIGTARSGTLTLTNVGLDPHQVAPLSVKLLTLQSSNSAWSLETPAPIAVGEPSGSAAVTVTFRPTQAGASQALLLIDSNDGLRPQLTIPLVALGRLLAPCTLNVQPGLTLDFGATPLNAPTVQGFELTNTTADDCIIGDPVLSSADQAFRWPGGVAPSGRTLPPGGRMSIRAELLAQAAQPYSASIRFYLSNAAAPSLTVGLRGQGDNSCFFVTPGTVDFGATTLGCGIGAQNAYAVNHCAYPVAVTQVTTSGAPFSARQAPFTVAPQSAVAIPVNYAPASPGDDVGALFVTSSQDPGARRVGLTGGTQAAAPVVDQWDQSTPKVDLLMVIDNSGSMAEEQHALAGALDHLWNRIALANADFHIAVTTTGMDPYTAGWSECPGGAAGGEGGRFFPVDNSHPRLLTPQTPDVKNALFQNMNVGLCHWKEQFTEPVVAALTNPLISASKAPGTPWPSDGNAGFLRDDARLALLAVSDADDDIDVANPPPVSYLIDKLRAVKHGSLDLVSFAALTATEPCSTVEAVGTRYMEIARQLNGQIFDICKLDSFGPMLDSALNGLLQPLSGFPLSSHPRDPAAMVVTVNGAAVTGWTYDKTGNRLVFAPAAVPAPGSHIAAKYEPACP